MMIWYSVTLFSIDLSDISNVCLARLIFAVLGIHYSKNILFCFSHFDILHHTISKFHILNISSEKQVCQCYGNMFSKVITFT
jgi:hypothetical protein